MNIKKKIEENFFNCFFFLIYLGVVIISTPQDLALLDVKKAINMFKKVNVPVSLSFTFIVIIFIVIFIIFFFSNLYVDFRNYSKYVNIYMSKL
jgi:hypothetical protein